MRHILWTTKKVLFVEPLMSLFSTSGDVSAAVASLFMLCRGIWLGRFWCLFWIPKPGLFLSLHVWLPASCASGETPVYLFAASIAAYQFEAFTFEALVCTDLWIDRHIQALKEVFFVALNPGFIIMELMPVNSVQFYRKFGVPTHGAVGPLIWESWIRPSNWTAKWSHDLSWILFDYDSVELCSCTASKQHTVLLI